MTDAKPKILVVDDSPANLVAMRRLLSKVGATLIEASSGQEALAASLEHEFALVLLDVNMPEMDGFEVCKALKSDPATRGIVVVMLTAMAQPADRERGLSAGADGFFTKPFSPLALLEKVEEVLGD